MNLTAATLLALALVCLGVGAWMFAPAAALMVAGVVFAVAGVACLDVREKARR